MNSINMSDICDFGRVLETECNLIHYTRNCGMKNLNQFKEDDVHTYLWRAGLLKEKANILTICYHHEQLFGNVFERRESKWCGVLLKHKRKKVKGEQICIWLSS